MEETKIFVVIAAWNEEKMIAKVVKSLKKGGYKNVIVVDDGSKDKTSKMAEKEDAIVIQHKKNKGQGAALRTGIKHAVKLGADVVVTFDADGQHRVSEIKNLVKPVKDGVVDVALGSRFLNKNNHLSFKIWLLLKIGIILHLVLYGVMLTDVHNGFRALSRKAAKKIRIKQDRMEHASEIIEQIGKHRLSYVEIPCTILYTKYSAEKGQSVMDRIKVGFKLFWNKIFG